MSLWCVRLIALAVAVVCLWAYAMGLAARSDARHARQLDQLAPDVIREHRPSIGPRLDQSSVIATTEAGCLSETYILD